MSLSGTPRRKFYAEGSRVVPVPDRPWDLASVYMGSLRLVPFASKGLTAFED